MYVLAMLCDSQPLSASILLDHRKKEKKEILIRYLLQLRHCIRLAHSMHIRIWEKALCYPFPRGGYEVQRSKIICSRSYDFYRRAAMQKQAAKPKLFLCSSEKVWYGNSVMNCSKWYVFVPVSFLSVWASPWKHVFWIQSIIYNAVTNSESTP